MLDLYEELKLLVAELVARKIDYALCGGLALAVHGIPRATVDIDILIPKILLNNVQRLAIELGYTQIAEPMIFARGAVEIHRISKIDPDTRDLLSLDLLLVTPEIETVWSSRQEVGWEKGNLWVVSRNGLIALKSLRASGQDQDDVRKLKEEFDET
jgi:hypothetical protein